MNSKTTFKGKIINNIRLLKTKEVKKNSLYTKLTYCLQSTIMYSDSSVDFISFLVSTTFMTSFLFFVFLWLE